MGRAAFITGIKFLLPPIEQSQSALCVRDFIAKVIRPTTVGIKIVKVLVEFFWQQPACDVEVFVMIRGEPARVLLSGFDRATRWRNALRDFQFAGTQHQKKFLASLGVTATHATLKVYVERARSDPAHGRTASLISPLRDFMRSNACGKSARRISSVTKSCAEMSPRRTASRASRMNRGV